MKPKLPVLIEPRCPQFSLWCRLLPALAGLLVLAGSGQARVEADPNQDYHVTPAAGPWMVCVASYMGDPAAKLAHDLALEVRQKYNLSAYIFNRGAEERRQQQQELEDQRRHKLESLRKMGYTGDLPLPHRTIRIEDQYAVLVGGYPDIEAARKALDAVKRLEAPQSVPTETISSIGLEEGAAPGKVQNKKVNPFATSFVVRNPTVPVNPQANEAFDFDFLKKLNEYEPLSLLQCHQPWTIAVQEFGGETRVLPTDQAQKSSKGFFEGLFSHDSGTQLDAGAQNAHNLAEALRKMGFESYVLHTRYSSVVTVGGYAGPDDPRLQKTQQALASNVLFRADASTSPGQLDPQRLNQQMQPLLVPVKVPQPPAR